MSLTQEVKKRIGSYMKERGFKVRNRTYYYILNDVAYCITFEQPAGLMYTWAHINPLYIPGDFVTLTYGNRLNSISDVRLPLLKKGVSPSDIDQWCASFFRCMDDTILPFFKMVDTPAKLVSYYLNLPASGAANGIISCPPVWGERLKVYTYLYMRDFQKMATAIDAYQCALDNCSFLHAALQQKLLEESEGFRQLLAYTEKEAKHYCEQIINRTTPLFQ